MLSCLLLSLKLLAIFPALFTFLFGNREEAFLVGASDVPDPNLMPEIRRDSIAPLQESFLDEGFILDKKIGVGQPKRIENAKILVANTAMDTDKIKIYGARVRVDSMQKVADIEKAERDKMRGKVRHPLTHPSFCLVAQIPQSKAYPRSHSGYFSYGYCQ